MRRVLPDPWHFRRIAERHYARAALWLLVAFMLLLVGCMFWVVVEMYAWLTP